jgi:uncharacterized protein YqeY
MLLKKRIEDDYNKAFKGKKEAEVLTLRMLKASIKNKEIEKGEALKEDDLIKIVNSEAKKRQDAIEDYKKGERLDLVKKEQEEINIVEKYLPKQLTDKEIEKIVKKVVEKNLGNKGNFGIIMGEVMKETKGKAPGAKVSQKVKEVLEQGE